MRDVIKEICDHRSRYKIKGASRRESADVNEILKFMEIMCVDSIADVVKKKDRVAIGYYIIRSISVYQSIFRHNVAKYIQSSPECLARISKLREIKVTLEHVYHFFVKNVSAGEYLAHFMPMNRMEDLFSYGDIILGRDFKSCLSEHMINEDLGSKSDFANGCAALFSDFSRLFSVRNELCHEAGFPTDLTYIDVNRMLSSGVIIMMSSSSIIMGEIEKKG